MGKFNLHQNNFTTGKIGKKRQGRSDLKDYFNGLDECVNFIPSRQGGVSKRPGCRRHRGIDMGANTKLIPFVFSKTESFVVILDPDQASVEDKIRMVDADTPTDYNCLAVNQYLSDGGISNTVGEGEYNYVQVGDTLFVTHSSGLQKPFVITRKTQVLGPTIYTFFVDYYTGGRGATANDLFMAVPYLDPNITATTLSFSATTGSIFVTASSAIFDPDQVGSVFKVTHGTTTGVVSITAYNSSTNLTGTVVLTLGSTAATDNWQEAAWSDFRGYPATVVSFQQRLIWGGTSHQPDTIFGSLTGNNWHMMERRLAQDLGSTTDVSGINYFGDVDNSDPLQLTLAATQVNRITWMASTDTLQVGTLGSEYIVTSDSSGGFGKLTATSKLQTSYGGQNTQPVRINSDTIFVTRDGKRFRNFRFNRDNGSFISSNMNVNNEEIINHNFDGEITSSLKIKTIIYQQSRDVIWALTTNNSLIALTFDPSVSVLAWHPHNIGGTSTILSITVAPNTNSDYDELFLLIERVVNGTTVRTIEKIGQDFDGTSLLFSHNPAVSYTVEQKLNFPWYLDSASLHQKMTIIPPSAPYIDGTIVFTTGYELETVRVLGDGVDLGEFLVPASGQIDVGIELTQAIVGYTYKAELVPVPLEAGRNLESAQALTKRVDRTTLRLYKTRGVDLYNLRDSNKHTIKEATSTLLTGDAPGLTPNNVDDRGQFKIVQENAYPCTILSLTYRGRTYDR